MNKLSVSIKKSKKRLIRRKKHIRKIVFGTADRPRLVVFRSNVHIYAQIIDDDNGTLTGCSTLSPSIKDKLAEVKGKVNQAKIIGEPIASLAKAHGITKVKFDRNGRIYHGRVKALADAARSGGLIF